MQLRARALRRYSGHMKRVEGTEGMQLRMRLRRYSSCGVAQQFTDAEIDAQLEQGGEYARHMALCRCDHGCRCGIGKNTTSFSPAKGSTPRLAGCMRALLLLHGVCMHGSQQQQRLC